MSTLRYPFTAIVGQAQLKHALLLNAINPAVGGVLIRGEKGTAKSTLARALTGVLPPVDVVAGCPYQCDPDDPFEGCPHCTPLLTQAPLPAQGRLPRTSRPRRVLTLPTNATEDRVCGTLDLERALQSGQRHFEPGLLAEAHRGILYIDEVNLLDDHIVDVLLDAAAMGINTVEREGIRMAHPARFTLVGTMNPEEGDLRPQLLDRFGLCVDVEAILDVGARAEIVRRRLAWERDPADFIAAYHKQQAELAGSIRQAIDLLPEIDLSDEQLHTIAQLCVRLDIRSHRADIVIAQAAMTFAALEGRRDVSDPDIRRAAELALPHRTRRRPFEESRLDPQQIQEAMAPPEPQERGDQPEPPASPEMSAPHNGTPPSSERETPAPEKVFDIGAAPEMPLPKLEAGRQQRRAAGRRTRSRSDDRRGRYIRSAMPDPSTAGRVAAGDVALDATLRAAAPHQTTRTAAARRGALTVAPEDIRVKVRERTTSTTIMLVVDASGSMGAAERMRAAKGAALSLLTDAYQRRDRVAMIAFRDQGAEVLLQPTDSVELAQSQLANLPTGGRTPLGHGLDKARQLAQQVRRRDPTTLLLTILISDGKANVPLHPGAELSPYEEAVKIAQRLSQEGIQMLLLDTEDDFLTLGLARDIAEAAGADYVKLADVEAATIERAVRAELALEPAG
jgi:magnesium chelatase subunit D